MDCPSPAAIRRLWIWAGSVFGMIFMVTLASFSVAGPTTRSFTLLRVSISR